MQHLLKLIIEYHQYIFEHIVLMVVDYPIIC